jgi:hypothetical protein
MAHNYDVGTRAWQSDPIEGWIASQVESKNVQGDKVKLVFQLANGEVSYRPWANAGQGDAHPFGSTVENHRDEYRRTPGQRQSFPATPDESCHTRS